MGQILVKGRSSCNKITFRLEVTFVKPGGTKSCCNNTARNEIVVTMKVKSYQSIAASAGEESYFYLCEKHPLMYFRWLGIAIVHSTWDTVDLC